MITHKLTEQHVIKESNEFFAEIDKASFSAKNLYNSANYLVRQSFIHDGKYLGYATVYHLVKKSDEYRALPAKVSNSILILLDKNWKSFFGAIKSYKLNPELFTGRPKLPKYLDKDNGRFVLPYDIQALSKRSLYKGYISPSKLNVAIQTMQAPETIKMARIVPKKGYYVLEVVYEIDIEPCDNLDYELVAGIDIGLSNLAVITSNETGFTPVVINGGPLKSINQYYNKLKAKLQAKLPEGVFTSKRIQSLTRKRDWKIKDYLHKSSKMIINGLVALNIGTLVIGKNDGWKQNINIGKRNNQNFVSIPFAMFINMLIYKAGIAGIKVVLQEESYTSKCSFLDSEPIHKHTKYSGRRIRRGMFKASTGRLINADVNGSYNIIRKAVPNAFSNGIEGVAVHPMRITPQR